MSRRLQLAVLVLVVVGLLCAVYLVRADERQREACARAIASASGTTEHDAALVGVCWP